MNPASAKLALHWNLTAAECYYRFLRCDGCPMRKYCEQGHYSMRGVVRELVRTLTLDGMSATIEEKDLKMLDEFRESAIIE